ncbi:MAG: ATP-dependent Clp protease proteolytic subunit [Deinococcota bacterium]
MNPLLVKHLNAGVTATLARVVLVCLFAFATSALAQSQAVWLVPIDTEITPATAQFVRARVDRANNEQPLALVFLIDTPGGRVDAMSEIVDSILQRAQVPTISIVEDAFSAGALIAMSADQMAMLPGASIGAALTVTLDFTSPNGMTAADEKINSATRSQFRSVAEATGRNVRVAEAMVDQRIEIPGLSTNEELVTLTPAQAVEFDIADLEASSVNDALEQLGYAGVPIERLEMSTLERTGTFLTSPIVAAALLAIGVIGLVVEFFTPGLGLPGGIGVLALLLFFSGAFIATPATNVDVAIAAIGILKTSNCHQFPGT